MVHLLPADEVVRLREWRPSDAAWYAKQSRDTDIQRFTTDPPDLTGDDVARAIDRLAQTPDSAGFLIADASTGQPLGTIAVDREDGTGHVSYWIAAGARGRGAATHALRLLAAWAFAQFDVRELRLWVHRANPASQRVAEKAGFVREPAHDRQREVKGTVWDTVAYVLAEPSKA